MSHGRPLGLSDAQIGDVVDAAAALPPPWRGRFLAAVADLLALREELGDNTMQAAIQTVPEFWRVFNPRCRCGIHSRDLACCDWLPSS